MRNASHEVIAGVFALGAVVGPLVALGWTSSPGPQRSITLTGVNKDGVWTDEEVTASNYWLKTFRRADLTLQQGETVLLRLTSADVSHGFYAPELGVGPLLIEPGHVVEVLLTGSQVGLFTYYCNSVCGRCHFYMQGFIRVLGNGEPPPVVSPTLAHTPCVGHQGPVATRMVEAPLASVEQLLARGAALFAGKGCMTCHGIAGSGGVPNPNYLKETVPQNNLLAEKLQLFERDDVATVIDLMERQVDLDSLVEKPPFPTYPRFLAQYKAVRALILNGNPAGRKIADGPAPPLNMPSWRHHVSERDLDALIAYLLSQFPWDEDE